MYVRVPGIPRADVFFMLLRESMSGQELSRKRAIAKKVWQDLLDVCVCVCVWQMFKQTSSELELVS